MTPISQKYMIRCDIEGVSGVASLLALAARTDIETFDCCLPYDPAARAKLIPGPTWIPCPPRPDKPGIVSWTYPACINSELTACAAQNWAVEAR
jgi:hypothetical protein